jgi:chromosome partitioning protein
MRVIAVVNQKGGVGQTTTAVNLGHALSRQGQRVALLDLDPQGHLSASLGLFPAPSMGVSEALAEGRPLFTHRLAAHDWGILVPSGTALADQAQPPAGMERATGLRDVLADAPSEHEVLLIDCPPSLGMLTVNAIVAADDVLIPVVGDYLSLAGLARLTSTLRRLAPLSRPTLRQWIFMSRFVDRRRLAREVHERIQQHFPDKLLASRINESAVMAECAGAGRTIFEYRENCPSAMQFLQLADDLMHYRVAANEQEETSHVA